MSAKEAFFAAFDAALDRRPFLLMEVGFYRTTDWCLFVIDKAGGDRTELINIQGLNLDAVLIQALPMLEAL